MAEFGDNVLDGVPQRHLPGSSVLVYRRYQGEMAERLQSFDVVQVAAVEGSRLVRWTFMIMLKDYGEMELLVENDVFNWLAFVEVPDLFESLGEHVLQLVEAMEGVGRVRASQALAKGIPSVGQMRAETRAYANPGPGRFQLLKQFRQDRMNNVIKILRRCGAVEQLV